MGEIREGKGDGGGGTGQIPAAQLVLLLVYLVSKLS